MYANTHLRLPAIRDRKICKTRCSDRIIGEGENMDERFEEVIGYENPKL